MKRLKDAAVVVAILLSVFVFTGCNMYSYGTSGMQTSYDNPQWAPPYYEGARYYYLPDIESYYDLSMNEFIFLDNGRWYYSRNIPSIYAGFDLNDCFAIVLNNNVYEPWMHHQYYVSHYPRYYYRDYYDHSNIPYVRGFNENRRSAIYWNENERSRARSWDDGNLNENRHFRYTNEDRQQQRNTNNQAIDRQSPNNSNNNRNTQDNTGNNQNRTRNSGNNAVNRQPQNDNNRATRTTGTDNTTRKQSVNTSETERTHDTNYYGRTIGNPVKVEKQMQDKSVTKSAHRR